LQPAVVSNAAAFDREVDRLDERRDRDAGSAEKIDGKSAFAADRWGHPLRGWTAAARSVKDDSGALVSVALTTAAAPLLGLDAAIGALVGAGAMLGDLLSSFVKRRLGFAPSSRLTGFDQIPESLLPLLACREPLSLSAIDILVGVGVFSVGAIALSPIFHRAGIRDTPF